MKKCAFKGVLNVVALILAACILLSVNASAELPSQRGEHPEDVGDSLNLDCRSAILIEADTQTVLYE